jgi:hypothetical protein
MRFVPIKNIEQQSVLALHRVRQGATHEYCVGLTAKISLS